MDIEISNRQNDLIIDIEEVKRLVKNVIDLEGQTCEEVYLHFVESKEMCSLHVQFFNDPAPTDCISFPIDDEKSEHRILGEVFVCPETAIHYAKENNVNATDEAYLYVIHGLLHLMGYLDKTESEIKKMRAAESRHVENFQKQ